MALEHVMGESSPWIEKEIYSHGDAELCEIYVRGERADLEAIGGDDFDDLIPGGYVYVRSSVTPDGDGMGTLRINAVLPGDADVSTLPTSTTFSIKMAPVEYDLIRHPHFDSQHNYARAVITKWLATDETKRIDADGNYIYDEDGTGNMQPVPTGPETDFCRAYTDGIRTYTRYYPVVVKISAYKRLPGASMDGRSTTGGEGVPFSPNIGKYDDPELIPEGFPEGHWWKSDDLWQQNQDQSWTRTEEWTYTPEDSSSTHGWIYAELD